MNLLESVFQPVYKFAINWRTLIKKLFFLSYLLLGAVLFAAWLITVDGTYYGFIEEKAINFGELAVILFCVTLIPGILKRFQIKSSLGMLLMLFRRQIGIVMYLLAMVHFTILWLYPRILDGYIALNETLLYELLGMVALVVLLTPVVLTSNDMSVRRLGVWWKRIHKLVYLAGWFILAHLVLVQMNSVWSISVLVFCILEVISFIHQYFKSKQSIS